MRQGGVDVGVPIVAINTVLVHLVVINSGNNDFSFLFFIQSKILLFLSTSPPPQALTAPNRDLPPSHFPGNGTQEKNPV